MKKLICLLLLVVTLGAMLSGCYTCDFCEEEKLFFDKNEEVFEGQKFEYCDDCKEDLEELANALDSLGSLY